MGEEHVALGLVKDTLTAAGRTCACKTLIERATAAPAAYLRWKLDKVKSEQRPQLAAAFPDGTGPFLTPVEVRTLKERAPIGAPSLKEMRRAFQASDNVEERKKKEDAAQYEERKQKRLTREAERAKKQQEKNTKQQTRKMEVKVKSLKVKKLKHNPNDTFNKEKEAAFLWNRRHRHIYSSAGLSAEII